MSITDVLEAFADYAEKSADYQNARSDARKSGGRSWDWSGSHQGTVDKARSRAATALDEYIDARIKAAFAGWVGASSGSSPATCTKPASST